MTNNDKQVEEILKKKNELESYVYSLRNNIMTIYEPYSDQQTYEKILILCDENEDWLYGEGQAANKSAFQTKLDEMLKYGQPIEKRYKEFNSLPEHFVALNNAINEATTLLNSQDEKYKHITNEDR